MMFFKARKVSNLPSTRTLANAAIEDYIGGPSSKRALQGSDFSAATAEVGRLLSN
jgi:hypothetical protein